MPKLPSLNKFWQYKFLRAITILGILMSPSLAHAHGEEVIFFPAGQCMALWIIFLLTVKAGIGSRKKLVLGVITIGIAAAIWLIPRNYFPSSLQYTGWGNFVCGFLPPFVIGIVALVLLIKIKRVQ